MLRSHPMTYPNTLIFMDFPSDDPERSATFYNEVFGWEVEPRPAGVFHRIVPGQNFLVDGEQGPTGNLHMGIYNVANARPHPDSDGVDPRALSSDGRTVRVWILVSDDDNADAIMERALARGRPSCGATTTGRSSTGSTTPSWIPGATR